MSSESHMNESLVSPTKSVRTISLLGFPEKVSSTGSDRKTQTQEHSFAETIIAHAENELRQAYDCFGNVLKTQYGWLGLEGG